MIPTRLGARGGLLRRAPHEAVELAPHEAAELAPHLTG